MYDHLVWYATARNTLKYRNLWRPKTKGASSEFVFTDDDNGRPRRLSAEELADTKSRVYKRSDLISSGYTPSCTFPIEFEGKTFNPRSGKSWRTNEAGVAQLKAANRLFTLGEKLYFKLYFDDFGLQSLENTWTDTAAGFAEQKVYVVQTTPRVIQRCLLMTTDPGDLVLDPTCGGGTTAVVCEQWGRRWITIDTSRVAVSLARQRLMALRLPYFELADSGGRDIRRGFRCRIVPRVTL